MNDTLHHQYAHCSIRQFKDEPLTNDQIQAIVQAASHTPSYMFIQAASIIGITDPQKQKAIAEICKQPYVAECGYLFVIVADMNRDVRIAEAQSLPCENLGRTERFFPAFYDATLMTMNMVTAAESMGLGTVVLGSINRDMPAMIELLDLPEYTFPCLGLAVGVPDQAPALKPRLPLDIIFMENSYKPLENPMETLEAYDADVHQYYDLRNTTTPVPPFTTQIGKYLSAPVNNQPSFLETLQKQGFLKD